MRPFFDPVGRDVPVWLKSILTSIRSALKDRFDWPIRLWMSPTADLPTFSEAEHEGAIAYDSTLDRLTYGNHTAWVTLQDYDATLAALAALDSSAGLLTQTGADTFAKRTLQAPAAGFTITNPAGTAGDPTFVLANDLSGLEGLSTTGVAVRTGTSTWTTRTITGTANEITLTNGDGVSGAPTVSIPTAVTFTGKTVTGGTYASPTLSGTVNVSGVTFSNACSFSATVSFSASTMAATNITGNRSLASWGEAGPNMKVSANELTNTSTAGGGTVTTQAASSFATPTFASTNSITVTNAATLYIDTAPTAGTNTTITNPWALYIGSGGARIGGALTVTGNATIGDNVADAHSITGNVTITESSGAGLILKDSAGNGTAADVNIEFQGADAVVKGSMGPSSSATSNIDVNSASGDVRILTSNTLQATFDGDGLNLVSGNWYEINATQVVKARITGWTAATGTAQRSGYATYTAAAISSPPTQAEVQAIANGLQDVSRTLKALIDDLHGTAGHGLIGA